MMLARLVLQDKPVLCWAIGCGCICCVGRLVVAVYLGESVLAYGYADQHCLETRTVELVFGWSRCSCTGVVGVDVHKT